jgi:hypothetical protein
LSTSRTRTDVKADREGDRSALEGDDDGAGRPAVAAIASGPYRRGVPNGGSDNCGECRFNPLSTIRAPQPALASSSDGRCEIRGIESIERPFYTYCANFHTGSRVPDGPVFAAGPEHERIPWHGLQPVRVEYLQSGRSRLVARDDGRHQDFASPDEYLAWWRERHPGERGEYPWSLHEAMLERGRRAAGHDGGKSPLAQVSARILRWRARDHP